MINLSPKISKSVIDEVLEALRMVKGYGSVEIYVQNSIVTQITVRNIKKTSVGLNGIAKEQVKTFKNITK